jgi:hypothetical protein
MVSSVHVVEMRQFSAMSKRQIKATMRLRRLILIGLASAMTLATLATSIVLAG